MVPYPVDGNNLIQIIDVTFVWWFIQIFTLYVLWLLRQRFVDKEGEKTMIFIQWYLIWNIFSVLRGCFIADAYWDWKNLLGNALGLMLPIMAYASTNKLVLQSIIRYYIYNTLPLFIVFAFLIYPGAFGFYLVPLFFLGLFWPALKLQWKWIMVGASVFVVLAALQARSTVIKSVLPVLLSFMFYIRLFVSIGILEFIRKLLFAAPFIFFILAVTGIFNVLNFDDYIRGDYVVENKVGGEIHERSLKGDTRTFLYIEVLKDAQKNNSWILGKSPARGDESEIFGGNDLTGRNERNGNEVAILNVFAWTGVIGVILFFLIFYKASYMAINESNNFYCKILGLFLAFRWCYAWVEDINYFTITTVFIYVLIGFCYSKSFRMMTDDEIKYWVWGVFEKRYAINEMDVLKPVEKKNI